MNLTFHKFSDKKPAPGQTIIHFSGGPSSFGATELFMQQTNAEYCWMNTDTGESVVYDGPDDEEELKAEGFKLIIISADSGIEFNQYTFWADLDEIFDKIEGEC